MNGTTLRAALVLIAVFAAGAFAGTFFERHHGAPTTAITDDAGHSAAAMAELRELLDLDDEQVGAIHALLAENQETVERMWEQLRPEVQAAMMQVHTEIAELLRPEQRERFHEWLSEQRERHRLQLRMH